MKKVLVFFLIFVISLGILGYFYIDSIKLKIIGYSINEIIIINKKLDSDNISLLLENNYIKDLDRLINIKDFNKEKFENYINFIKKGNTNYEQVVSSVNKNYDYDIIDNFISNAYYISDNLDRYLNYYKSNNELSYDEIITNVNSNLDYDYYTNISDTDMSKEYLILVNKYYKLSKDYIPDDLIDITSSYGSGKLRKVAYEQFIKLVDAGKKEGYYIISASPYRSYSKQEYLYNKYSASDGIKEADTYSARPGHSEHQTGLAVDVSVLNSDLESFGNTNEFIWMKNNCYKYGYILRYPEKKEYITGYIYEPWHYRYVGVNVATKIHELGITFEEYYAYFVK